jgi:phosphopantetheine adenylyltransferase
MQPHNLISQKPSLWKNQVKIGSIEIRVISKPKIKVEKLEGILKLKGEKSSSTKIVRNLRKEDYEREEKRLKGSD